MSIFAALKDMAPQTVWDGVVARVVEGRQMSFAVVELAPNAIVARHQHMNEQIGLVLKGTMTFTIGGETRVIQAGDTYNIPGDLPHEASAGPDGAVVIDVFSPVRADWAKFPKTAPTKTLWP
jgi:quercetin dioxygenase-like cupin family protein